ncbi:unnamed protein product [Plutella xylostella]|uniref:(diamondback moth) hypothetical protein n=1 Tax=Plutella xylostella TaxID=51655 RepID=A0A8S4E449_PLUXY|nr:unnamed protein product [Plutella xylostella]
MMVVTVATVAGNLAVLVAIRRATPRFPTHYPLASLAVADLMLGLFVLPLAAARELFVFQPNWIICACWSTLDVFCCTASILSLCTLGWERWSGITSPLARARRWKLAKLFAILIWPVSATVALPTALIPSPQHYVAGEEVKACTVNTNIVYVFFSVSLSFYAPTLLMSVLYAKILAALAAPSELRAHRGRAHQAITGCEDMNGNVNNNNLESAAGDNKSSLQPVPRPSEMCSPAPVRESTNNNCYLTPRRVHVSKPCSSPDPNLRIPSPLKVPATSPGGIIPRQRTATQTIVMLMSLFLLCWTPFFVMLPIDSLCNCVSVTAWQLCTWLGYINSALDPLVYALASPTVRRALHDLSRTLSTTSGGHGGQNRGG